MTRALLEDFGQQELKRWGELATLGQDRKGVRRRFRALAKESRPRADFFLRSPLFNPA